MTQFVRCIDNTLAKDDLRVGEVYEVLQANERDGYYQLAFGSFTMARFQPISASDAGYDYVRLRPADNLDRELAGLARTPHHSERGLSPS